MAAMAMDCRPEEQKRLMVTPAVGNGELGQHNRQAGQVAVLLTGVAGGPDHHVLHLIGRQLRVAVQQRIDAMRQHVIGSSQIEAAPKRLGQPRSHTVDYDDISHGPSLTRCGC